MFNPIKNKIALVSLAIITVLSFPLIFNKKSLPPLIGPSLNELKYDEITFRNGNSNLSGMVFYPKNKTSYPVAIIIHGSGPSKRENKWYLIIAKYLQDNGFAVLYPDKRGSEKSDGSWIGTNFEDLSTDIISAVDFAKKNLNYTSIGVVGMSQGGWIAPIVASKTELDFVVSMSGPMVTTDEQLLFEETNRIAKYTYKPIAKLLAKATTHNLKKKESLKNIMGFDPIPYWKQVDIPVLIAFGEGDKNLPVEKSINILENNNLDFQIKKYPEGGHGITHSGRVQTDFLTDLKNFIENVDIKKTNFNN